VLYDSEKREKLRTVKLTNYFTKQFKCTELDSPLFHCLVMNIQLPVSKLLRIPVFSPHLLYSVRGGMVLFKERMQIIGVKRCMDYEVEVLNL